MGSLVVAVEEADLMRLESVEEKARELELEICFTLVRDAGR